MVYIYSNLKNLMDYFVLILYLLSLSPRNMETKLKDIVAAYDTDIKLRKEQEQALLFLMKQKGDLLVNLPVGFGKSLIYHLLSQALATNRISPVVSPLNIIHKDQMEDLKKHGIFACRINICSKLKKRWMFMIWEHLNWTRRRLI